MKCELCDWAEKPESVPSLSRHIGTYHQDIVPDQVVVWRDSELVAVSEYDGEEQLIEVFVKKVVPSPKAPIVDLASLEVESLEDFEDSPRVIDLDELPE
jgi:hypothetical protein